MTSASAWTGACEFCRDVRLHYGKLTKLARDDERHSLLLQCPQCMTVDDLYPEERGHPETVDPAEARKRYPGAL